MTAESSHTFSATAVRFVRQKSPRIFQEAFKIFHDRESLEARAATFAAVGSTAFEYALQDQPIHGPIRVYAKTRASELRGAEAIDGLFGVNRSLGLYAPATPTAARRPRPDPERWEPEVLPLPERFERYLGEIGATFALQQKSYVAPQTITEDHPWWDANQLHACVGVRFFASDGSGQFLEQLDVICLRVTENNWPVTSDMALDFAGAHAAAQADERSMSVLAVEAMDCAVKLNGNPLFAIQRSSRLTFAEYIAAYVT